MTNLIRIATCIFFALLLGSCSKKNNDEPIVPEPVPDPCNNILEVSLYHQYGSEGWQRQNTVQYDNKGRITKVIGNGQNQSTYTYFKDSIRLVATDIFGNDISLTYYLDTKGRIRSTSYFNYQYTYNAEGYLVSFRQPYGVSTEITGSTFYTMTYENGDLKTVATTEEFVSPKVRTMTYYDEPNQDLLGYNEPLYIADIIGDRNSFNLIKAGFYGKHSAHLLKAIDFSDDYDYVEPYVTTYAKDNKGRITTKNNEYRFKYQCP